MINKKIIIVVIVLTILLAIIGLYTTLASDASVSNTISQNADLAFNFDLSNNINKEVTVSSNTSMTLDINVKNTSAGTIKYGIAYAMINPSIKSTDLTIAKLSTSLNGTVDLIERDITKAVKLIIINNTSNEVTISLSTITGYELGGDLIVPTNKELIMDTYTMILPGPSGVVTGLNNETLETGTNFNLTNGVTCTNCTITSVNPSSTTSLTAGIHSIEYIVTMTDGTKYKYNRTINVISSILLYDAVELGDYVSYTGNNGCSEPYCSGETVSSCYDSSYLFTTKGWRVAYKLDNSVYLISGGAPECANFFSQLSTANLDNLYTVALKYCNPNYVAGGSCSNEVSYPVGESDFYQMTLQSNGTGYHVRDVAPACYVYNTNIAASVGCGLGNNLIDNGGYYYYAVLYQTSCNYWDPIYRQIGVTGGGGYFGLRPIIKLDTTIKLTGGNGTLDSPYTMSERES